MPAQTSAAAAVALSCLAALAAGQAWSQPDVVSPTLLGWQAARGGNGVAAVLLLEPDGGFSASVRPGVGSAWSAPTRLTTRAGDGTVAVTPDGDVLALWVFRTTNTFTPNTAQLAWRRSSTGAWGAAFTVAEDVYGASEVTGLPSVGLDATGAATLVFEVFDGTHCSVAAVTATADGAVSPRTLLAANVTPCLGWVRAAVTPDGAAVVVTGAVAGNSGAIMAYSRASATSAWSTNATVAPYFYRRREPRVALSASGAAVTLWLERTGESFSARPTLGGNWTPPASPPGMVTNAQSAYDAALGPDGGAVFALSQYETNGSHALRTVTRGREGTWGANVTVAEGADATLRAIAVTPGGSFVLASASAAWVSLPPDGGAHWQPAPTWTAGAELRTVSTGQGGAIALFGPGARVSTVELP